ncbi:MAG: PHB depolymerase family esterase [Spirosomataceae bacterium]
MKSFLNGLLLMGLALFVSCKQSADTTGGSTPKPFVVGKNRFTIKVDGDDREYYVHVPASYTGKTAVPVVIMCHGTSGDGEKFYNISGWKELGEVQNVITVFPSSWAYCVIDDGVRKNTTKWNVYPGSFTYCSGETPRDDIKFMRSMIDEIKQKYEVDSKRIYLVGFSNGGEFASRCMIELSDILAACVANAGPLPANSTYTPKRLLPIILQIGNSDDKLLALLGTKTDVPMALNQLLIQYPVVQTVLNAYISSFKTKTTYTAQGDPSTYTWYDYAGTSGNSENFLRFVLVKGLDHQYPNGVNHPMKGAEVHWNWMKDFKLP